MISEMDILKMDERQRLSWLQANRLTLFLVGLTWIGMIAWELAHEHLPLFLIVMVPVFALFRFATYQYFQRTSGQDTP